MQNIDERPYVEQLLLAGKFKSKDELMEYIILRQLGFESTEERKSDRLDFHETSIVSVKKALDAAYLAGQLSVKQ